ncbi:transmembrane protein 56 [Iris pallida]|uniref:Transmembrane protein 56 n=1 Tax=Iris pallida TaxID=29817 RepID=A0AAX6ERL8_IRIPA|nr:transmembrane protein 56 [Iris pallida]
MEGNFGPTEQVLWPVSVFSGIVMCKIVYELTGQISLLYFNKCYNKLNKSQKIEWNNRGFSTFHAIVAAAVSFYLLVLSDTFKDGNPDVLVVHNKSILSDAMFGVSLGYFLSDLAMILWLFPSLGGKEYANFASWALHLCNASLPDQRQRTDLHTHGFVFRNNNSLCKSKMVSGSCWSEEL